MSEDKKENEEVVELNEEIKTENEGKRNEKCSNRCSVQNTNRNHRRSVQDLNFTGSFHSGDAEPGNTCRDQSGDHR